MLKEFREFAIQGSMVDMAVGIIIGAAFGTVIKSFVDDIIMPIISGIFKIPDFSNLFFILSQPEVVDGVDMTSIAAVREAGGVALGYGLFINSIFAFFLVAFALFFVVRNINRLKEEAAEEAGPTEVELLTEIRDTLNTQ